MQLGIHVGTFPQATVEEIFDAALGYGFECVHFNFKALGMPSMPEQIDDALCKRVADGLASRGLSMCSVSCTFNMIHPDPAVRQDGLRRLETVAAAAPKLGAPLLTLCTGTRNAKSMWRAHADNDTAAAWSDLTESLRLALDVAQRYNVTLGIEPEVSNVVDSTEKARRLLDEMGSSRLKIIMDGANLFHAGELARMDEILAEAFEFLGEDIVLGHAKDLDRDGEAGHLAAGQGLLNYDYYLELFRKANFAGPLVMHGLAESDVAESVAFLRKKIASVL